MAIKNRIAEFHDEMTAWRRDIHAHPEIAFEEVRTADIVATPIPFRHRCHHDRWVHRVDPDIVLAQFQRRHARHRVNSAL